MRIDLRGVRKSFGAVEVLHGIDLCVEAGDRVALVGPNGSGKSTLIRIVPGLLSCEGEVLLDGRPPRSPGSDAAQRLAYVPQVAPALAAPAGELVSTLAALRGIDPARVAATAARIELDLASIRDRPFRLLSGGMKQKLLVSLALSCDAELLVLDEPTASLDAASRERFFGLVAALPAHVTVLLCSHRLEELRHLTTRVVELADGRVVRDAPVEQVLESQGRGVVEVSVRGAHHDAWLSSMGFRAGAPGWWVRTVTQSEKLGLVPEVSEHLNGELRNLVVRDLESIETEADR